MAIIYANETNFNETINTKNIVIVDFFANWCGPCKMLSPMLEEIDNENIVILKVDVDSNPEIANKYKIMSIPTIILFKNGMEKSKKIGLCSKQELEEMINQ